MGNIIARPAIVIAHTRAGGSWLMHCLSSHPDIFCPRGEPLLPGSNFKRSFPDASDTQILSCIGMLEMYHVGIAKVTYKQFTEEVESWMEKYETPVIHLFRENILRVVVSQFITSMSATNQLGHPAHTYKEVEPLKVEIPPEKILAHCEFTAKRRESMSERLSAFKTLDVTYADMIGGEGNQSDHMDPVAGEKICNHLGIRNITMTAQLKRVNAYPLNMILKNWDDVRIQIENSPYQWCLEEENNYRSVI